MKRLFTIILFIVAICIVGYAVSHFILRGPRSPLFGFRPSIQKSYEEIKLGDTLEHIIEHLA